MATANKAATKTAATKELYLTEEVVSNLAEVFGVGPINSRTRFHIADVEHALYERVEELGGEVEEFYLTQTGNLRAQVSMGKTVQSWLFRRTTGRWENNTTVR